MCDTLRMRILQQNREAASGGILPSSQINGGGNEQSSCPEHFKALLRKKWLQCFPHTDTDVDDGTTKTNIFILTEDKNNQSTGSVEINIQEARSLLDYIKETRGNDTNSTMLMAALCRCANNRAIPASNFAPC